MDVLPRIRRLPIVHQVVDDVGGSRADVVKNSAQVHLWDRERVSGKKKQ